MLAGAVLAFAGVRGVSARRRRPGRLRGKVAIITGGSRGLGLALAEELGRAGARLVLAARNAEELQRARNLLLERRCVLTLEDILLIPADLRNADQAERLIAEATRQFGRVDILINNAGIISVGPIENQTLEDFRDVMDANFFSGLHCTLAVLPQMLARRSGAIVNITSIGGKVAVPHLLPYTASKFAAVGLSEGLSAELRWKGIQVTTVCPGLMRTGSHLNAYFKGKAAREYSWFSIGAGFPGVSTSARSAARKIVRALIRGKREIAITPQAILAARLSNVMPGVTSWLLQAANFTMPSAAPSTAEKYRGAEVTEFEIKPLTALAGAAARRYNQVG